MSERIFLLPLWIRVWHWSNALLMLVLAATGFSLHFAGTQVVPVVEFSLSARLHDIAGLALVALYAFYAVANIVSGNWWQYIPKPPGILDRCNKQTMWFMRGIFKGEPHPYPVTKENKFNASQALLYWMAMYLLVPFIIISGLIFMFPQFAPDRLFGMDGLVTVAVLHYLAGVAIVLFMIFHIYLGTTGTRVSSQFKTMLTGWHEH